MSGPLNSVFDGVKDVPQMIAQLATAMAPVITDLANFEQSDISGEPYQAIIFDGAVFEYNSESTAASDGGLTTIVSTGRVYERNDAVSFSNRVLSSTTSLPPADPAKGDAYVIPDAPQGDWAQDARKLAVWTSRGWSFKTVPAGTPIWVADTETYIHRDEQGAWQNGLPISVFAPGSISAEKFTNPFASSVLDTLAAPPVNPQAGMAWLVSDNPTAGTIFEGRANNVAMFTAAGWHFAVPDDKSTLFHVERDELITFRDGSWLRTVERSSRTEFRRHIYDGDGNISVGVGWADVMSISHTPAENEMLAISLAEFSGLYYLANTTIGVNITAGIFIDDETDPQYELAITATAGATSRPYSNLADLGLSLNGALKMDDAILLEFSDTAQHDIKIKIKASYSSSVSSHVTTVLTERVALS